MEPLDRLRSRLVVLLRDDIDTDQIIPARYLKTTTKVGLGKHLFADWRYLPDGSPHPDFVLNRSESQGAHILLAGHNFACGSSREHAPWALWDWGFRAVIATSFADIFAANALKNGMLPLVLPAASHLRLRDLVARDPNAEVEIEVSRSRVRLPDGEWVEFPLDSFSAKCLVTGTDQLGYLLSLGDQISAFERRSHA